jgi:hypothetical protein
LLIIKEKILMETDEKSGTSAGKSRNGLWAIIGAGCLLMLCCIAFAFLALGMMAANSVVETPVAPNTNEQRPGNQSNRQTEPVASQTLYWETFDAQGDWGGGRMGSGNSTVADATFTNGVMRFSVFEPESLYWSTAEENFGDGLYEVETKAVSGTLDNGYGMLIRFNDDDFYMFQISSDGYAWAGAYQDGGQVVRHLSGEDGWIKSDAINQGLGATNVIQVRAVGDEFTFMVNDQPVLVERDSTVRQGNIAVFVETFDEGDVVIEFDNFRVSAP